MLRRGSRDGQVLCPAAGAVRVGAFIRRHKRLSITVAVGPAHRRAVADLHRRRSLLAQPRIEYGAGSGGPGHHRPGGAASRPRPGTGSRWRRAIAGGTGITHPHGNRLSNGEAHHDQGGTGFPHFYWPVCGSPGQWHWDAGSRSGPGMRWPVGQCRVGRGFCPSHEE